MDVVSDPHVDLDTDLYIHSHTHGLDNLYSDIYRHTDPNAHSHLFAEADPYPDKYVDAHIYGLKHVDVFLNVDLDLHAK